MWERNIIIAFLRKLNSTNLLNIFIPRKLLTFMSILKGFPSIYSTCDYVPKIFFLNISLMCNVPSVSLRSKISFMDKYFPTGMFPLSIFVPFFKAFSIFIAYQTDSVQLLNTGNSSMCHRLTYSSLEFCKKYQ